MRVPIFKITNDDDPGDYAFPRAVSLQTMYDNADPAYDAVYTNVNPPAWIPRFVLLERGCSVTVGGGAAVQFTITRIR